MDASIFGDGVIDDTLSVVPVKKKDHGSIDAMERFQKLIYVIDRSGSMNQGMAPDGYETMYDWTPEQLERVREFMKEKNSEWAMQKLNPKPQTVDEFFDIDGVGEDDEDDEPPYPMVVEADDATLKTWALRLGLHTKLELELERSSKWKPSDKKSKIETVQDAARKFVKERFKKYPEAEILVFGFDDQVECLSTGYKEEDVLHAIDSLFPRGGTRIYQALEYAIKELIEHPSKIGSNHIVLVTDACDSGAVSVRLLEDQMLQHNIVLDFIFIEASPDAIFSHPNPSVVNTIKAVARRTGGGFESVIRGEDFTQKFLEMSARKMLPPAKRAIK